MLLQDVIPEGKLEGVPPPSQKLQPQLRIHGEQLELRGIRKAEAELAPGSIWERLGVPRSAGERLSAARSGWELSLIHI